MDTYYNNMKTSLNNFIGSNNLYNIIIYNLELDYDILNFILYYIESNIFNKCIDSNYLIKDYISKDIDNFELYYSDYMEWYNKNIISPGTLPTQVSNSDKNIKSFNDYFENSLKELVKISV